MFQVIDYIICMLCAGFVLYDLWKGWYGLALWWAVNGLLAAWLSTWA